MSTKLAKAIRQTRPFGSRAEEAVLSIVFAAERISYASEKFLKEQAGITGTQYNTLRILRGAGDDGMPCGEVGARMIQRVPDVTRLLDRLEQGGLIERERPADNRRVVLVRLSKRGRELVDSLDKPVRQFNAALLGGLGAKKLEALIALVDEATPD